MNRPGTQHDTFRCSSLRSFSTDLGSMTLIPIVVTLFLAGMALRLVGLDYPPLTFHPTRQYRSLILARSFYLPEKSDAVTRVAQEAARQERTLEPPVMEVMASWVYQLTGGESFRVGGGLSVLFWGLGGLFLLALAYDLGGEVGAVATVATYLFAPFAVQASRSFQPEALMVCLTLAALWLSWRFWHAPEWRSLFFAGGVAAMACLVKPTCTLLLTAPYIGWLLEGRMGFHSAENRVGEQLCIHSPFPRRRLLLAWHPGGWLASEPIPPDFCPKPASHIRVLARVDGANPRSRRIRNPLMRLTWDPAGSSEKTVDSPPFALVWVRANRDVLHLPYRNPQLLQLGTGARSQPGSCAAGRDRWR